MTQYGLRSWRFFWVCFFFCSSLSKKFSRANIEPGTKKKMMGEGARGEDSEKNRLLPPPSPRPRQVQTAIKWVACEQALLSALLFRQATRAARQCVSERRSREGLRKCLSLPHPLISRLLSRASRASTFHDIPQKESLVAGYKVRSKTVVVYAVFYNVWRGILKVQKTFSNVQQRRRAGMSSRLQPKWAAFVSCSRGVTFLKKQHLGFSIRSETNIDFQTSSSELLQVL